MRAAISQRNELNQYGDKVDILENSYVSYLENFGIDLIVIPNASKNIEKYILDCNIDAIIISGGNDINPESYGSEKCLGLNLSDGRDKTEKRLIELGIEKNIPILGICRGMQFINVFFGGKLNPDIKKISEAHKTVPNNHMVNIIDDKSKEFFGEKAEINSYHNQGISLGLMSRELRVFAMTEDEVVEGIYHPNLKLAAVQWHPERKSPDDEFNEKIINAFVNRELFWKEK
jgi:gamma-glutamyl-gamma-aminobutyrate hydrolase PuuD